MALVYENLQKMDLLQSGQSRSGTATGQPIVPATAAQIQPYYIFP